MKFMDEYRDPEAARRLAHAIRGATTRPHVLMEICGGQTHAILRFGIDQLLPPEITLVHGPGCPVCVTPVGMIDTAHALALRPEVTLCSFGDMLRVPGSAGDLLSRRARGGDVRMVYSPLDAVALAAEHPDREVVFFAVGFETTAPATALAVKQAAARGVSNFSILCAHVLVPPAMEAILAAEGCRVQGFLAAGHVCTVMGFHEYDALAARYGVPIVVTGFEPVDILEGILQCVRQLEDGTATVVNRYARSVSRAGNVSAQALLEDVFETADRAWRGLGPIPGSGLRLRGGYRRFDALEKLGETASTANEDTRCRSGEVLQGTLSPPACEAFGSVCTPDHPLGAPMVSNEGACAAYYRYRAQEV